MSKDNKIDSAINEVRNSEYLKKGAGSLKILFLQIIKWAVVLGFLGGAFLLVGVMMGLIK